MIKMELKGKIKYLLILSICILQLGCSNVDSENEVISKKIEYVDFANVKITDSFWSPKLERHVNATLPVCIDQIENQTGRIKNFENASLHSGEHSGIFYDDSDVYKALEGMAYSLINNPNKELENKCDEWIDKISSAQEPDGYINTFYSLTGLDNRWTNMDMHEMYCAGHLIEAGIAYYKATGKQKLLDVSIAMTNHMMNEFGPGKRHWVPGHEEIELALVKLYETTKEERYLDFANWLLEERGHGHGSLGNEGKWNPIYYQDIVPVKDLSEITGHAVRAMYLFCGMADVAALKNDSGYVSALNRLWDDVILTKMYITGGIGSSRQNEGFTEPYDLPNYDAYSETCASVGMVYWNARMNQLTGDSKYVDILERSLYNAALAGVSINGDLFFYVNPLASHGNHHRKEWYGTACCPSQVSRFIPSIGSYIYATSEDALWVNLFIGNETTIELDNNNITLSQKTNYPWDGNISLIIEEAKNTIDKDLRLRIPDWCKSYSLTINGQLLVSPIVERGYAVLEGKWNAGDEITLSLEMPVEIVSADPRVKENIGKKAIQRGPLVYCMEEIDNINTFENSFLTTNSTFTTAFNPSLLQGIVTIVASNAKENITLIPYYAWDNREEGEMKVWIDYSE